MAENDFDNWANWYDQIYSHKVEDKEDLEFYKELLEKRSDGKFLEMACGTGRLYLEFLEMGYDIHGLDISQNMLNKLENKADRLDQEPVLFQKDAADFEIDHQYDIIYYPFSAFIHHSELEDQIGCMNSIYEHLKEDGIFALDMPVFDFEIIANYGQITREEHEQNGTNYMHEFWSKLTNQTEQKHEMTQRQLNVDTGEIVFETTFELGIIPKNQMELLLIQSGFEEYEFHHGFNHDEDIKPDSERLTLVAYK